MFFRKQLTVRTGGRGTYDITDEVQGVVRRADIDDGLCNVFLSHTSASLMLCENADPSVRRDLEAFFSRLVPDGERLFSHTAEGPDDMPAHVRSVLTQNTVTIPVVNGAAALGTWQGLYLWEHRHHAHTRRVTVSVVG